jgi:hypothetical protein
LEDGLHAVHALGMPGGRFVLEAGGVSVNEGGHERFRPDIGLAR